MEWRSRIFWEVILGVSHHSSRKRLYARVSQIEVGGFNQFRQHIEQAGDEEREVNILVIVNFISKANQELKFQMIELVSHNSLLVCYHLESCKYTCSIKTTLHMKRLQLYNLPSCDFDMEILAMHLYT